MFHSFMLQVHWIMIRLEVTLGLVDMRGDASQTFELFNIQRLTHPPTLVPAAGEGLLSEIPNTKRRDTRPSPRR